MENVYEAEIELFQSLKPGSIAVMPDDDPVLWEMVQSLPLKFIKVGLTENADYRVTEIRCENGWVRFKVNGETFAFPGLAGFLAKNAAMAIAMADQCGYKMAEMQKEWPGLKLPNGRFQEQSTASGVRVIFDGYNASPASFEAAIDSFEKIPNAGKKILVFSDMLEMGTAEREVHEQLGARIAASSLQQAVAYGPRSRWAVEIIKARRPDFKINYFENSRETASFLASCLQKEDLILLKGSRGMRVEEILTYLPDSVQSCASGS
jgi:UDP-N-acetylmuramoyl-tripeptide--D-alanyl-D-alanine ligase